MSVGLRAIIIPRVGVRVVSTPVVEWRGRLRSERVLKKGPSFFSRKLSPREKQLFPACESQSPNVPPKYIPVRLRSSIEQQVTGDSGSSGWRRGRFVCRKRSRVFPGSFPLLRSGNVRRRRSRLTCCRITGSTLAECPLASYLSSSPYLALPGSLFNPRPIEQRKRTSHGGTRRWNWSGRKHLD